MEPEREPDTLPDIQPDYFYLENGEQFSIRKEGWKYSDYKANRPNPSKIYLVSINIETTEGVEKLTLIGKRVSTPNPDSSVYRYKLEFGPKRKDAEGTPIT